MLSTRVFTSSDAAKGYYSHGDYYGSEGEGTWVGEGAEELGLKGDFAAKSDQSFYNLLKGVLPNGQILGRKTKDDVEHCPGVDLTFSAPKSFSIQMLVYASKEERQAMEAALIKSVSSTLKYIEEQGYVYIRKGHGGKEREAIHKLSFATFTHTTNRNLEPQAHVHCFLANVGKRKGGEYRSISFDKILKENKFFGQVFRNELAVETKKLGYEIIPTILSDGSSSFELTKIDSKLIHAFSTRRQEIEALCKLHNVTTKEARDNIVINSRKAKQLKSEEELNIAWKALENEVQKEIAQEQLDKLNKITNEEISTIKAVSLFDKAFNMILSKFPSHIFKSKAKINEELVPAAPLTIKDLASLCLEDVTHYKSVFSKEDLAKKTLKFAIGHYTIREIDAEHQNLEKDGILIRHINQYTSKALLTQERQILKYAQNAIGGCKAILEEKYFDAHMNKFIKRELSQNSKFQINAQQKQVAKHIVCSKDKIITVVGLPGVGKSTVLNAVRDISAHKISKIISLGMVGETFEGLAPTASAAKTLGTSAKIETNTIHSFLGKNQGYLEGRGLKSLGAQKTKYKDMIIFVDESSLIPTHIMHKLLKLQNMMGFRLAFTGDTKQLNAVEAGQPFVQMIKVIQPIELNVIVRQEDEAHKKAIIAVSQGDIETSFMIHADNIQAKEDLSDGATKLYLQSDVTMREKILLISPTRVLRDSINNDIRIGLQMEGKLEGEVKEFIALRQKDMSVADYQFAPSFNIGDTLKFHKAYKNITRDEYLLVKQVDAISNSLVMQKENGREILFQLRKEVDYQSKFEVFKDRELQLQQGLKIIFTKNNRDYLLINSETAVIRDIGKKAISLQFENKEIRKIPWEQFRHIDYGYCITVHAAQGKTYDIAIAAIKNHLLLNNQKLWLVTLSRHRDYITIYTEDRQQLKINLINNDGNEMTVTQLQEQIDLLMTKSSSKAKSLDLKYDKLTQQVDKTRKIDISNDNLSGVINSNDKNGNKTQESNHYNSKHNHNKMFENEISAQEIHHRLCDNINGLARQLLPNIANKRIITTKNSIQCGSINIVTKGSKRGLWTRYSTGQTGNLFGLIKEAQGLGSIKDAIEWSRDYLSIYNKNLNQNDFIINQNSRATKNMIESLDIDDSKLQKLIPTPKTAMKFNPEKTFYNALKDKSNKLEAVYEYRNIKNELCGYVVRIKNGITNDKKTLPVVYAEDDKGKRRWVSKGFGDNRCLYNEQQLANNNSILIVEGEKAADKAQKLYPEFTVISWCGGANGFNKSNWGVLIGKDVVIWPDNDQAGLAAAEGIKTILEGEGTKVNSCKIVDLKKIHLLPDKWDLADKLPEYIHSHQIIGLLLSEAKIDNNVRIERTLKEYMNDRKLQTSQDIGKAKFDSLGEYIIEQNKLNVNLVIEEQLVKMQLQNSPIIYNGEVEKVTLASQIASNHNLEAHSQKQIQDNLSQLFNSIPKNVIIQATKIAALHNERFITEYSKAVNQHSCINQDKTHYLVHIMALKLIQSHIEGKDIDNPQIVKNISSSLNKDIEQQVIKIEKNQVSTQKQISKQIQMEI